MSLDVFSPPSDPAVSSARQAKSRIKSAQFGDGYSQRSSDGLNAVTRAFSAQWASIPSTDADTIEAFLEAHTSTAFLWTPPLDSVQRKWIAGDWSRSYVAGDLVSLSANLTEVFDL